MGKNWRFNDLTNQRFNRLQVTALSHKNGKRYYWHCLCDCGKNKIVESGQLTSGETKSCGCLRKELREKSAVIGELNKHPLYFVFNAIKARCFNKNNPAYDRYGGRGITICEEWRNDFLKFYNWSLANGWKEGLQIDRINNQGNYSQHNCRFVTPKENNFNKRTTLLFEYEGQQLTALDLEILSGVPARIISSRINENGWPVDKAISTSYMKGRRAE